MTNNGSFEWYPVKLETKTTCVPSPDGVLEIATNAMTLPLQTDKRTNHIDIQESATITIIITSPDGVGNYP